MVLWRREDAELKGCARGGGLRGLEFWFRVGNVRMLDAVQIVGYEIVIPLDCNTMLFLALIIQFLYLCIMGVRWLGWSGCVRCLLDGYLLKVIH